MKKTHQMLRSIVTLSLCFVLFCGTAFAGTFPDVPDSADYAEAVESLAEMGILRGDSYGYFNPNNTITRAEAATIICRMLGNEEDANRLKTSRFSDVSSSHWAVGYVAKAEELGIIGGYGNGKFGPSDAVTYEQMVKMIICAWGYEDMANRSGGYPTGYLSAAKALGMVVNPPGDTSKPAARKSIAVLIYDSLQIPTAYENGGDSV